MKFVDALKNGKFLLSVCKSCNQAIWPPSDSCPLCLQDAEWISVNTDSLKAELIESSETSMHEERTFGLVEIDIKGMKIRLIGRIISNSELKPGTILTLRRLEYRNEPYFEFEAN